MGTPGGLSSPVTTSEGHFRVTHIEDTMFQIMAGSPAWPPRPEQAAGTPRQSWPKSGWGQEPGFLFAVSLGLGGGHIQRPRPLRLGRRPGD